MKNTVKKRAFAFILASLMLLSAVSCSEKQQNDANNPANKQNSGDNSSSNQNTNNTDDSMETENESAKEYKADIPEGTNYGGATVTIYTYPDSGTGEYWCDMDFCFTEETGDTLSDALYDRMRTTEETLGIKLATFAAPTYTGDALKRSVTAQDSAYDFAFIRAMACDSFAQNNLILNLRTMDSLALESPWWDSNITDGLSVGGKVYMTAGDISIMAKKTIRVLYFNKSLASNYDIPNPYDMVDEMRWTVDNLHLIAQYVSDDLNGDGKMTEDADRFGMLTTDNCIYPMMIGCGVVTAEKDENDIPRLAFYNERTQTAWEKITALCYNKTYNINAKGSTVKMFMEDRGLFSTIELHNLNVMRDMDSDFGILPNPMLDETQGCYYSTINSNVASMLVVPSDCPDQVRAAHVMDVMGARSKTVLTPAYIESYLKGKVSRDNESENSINIIFNNIRYDIGHCYNWGSLGSFMQDLFKIGGTELASTYQRMSKIADKTMSKAIDAYLDNNK